MIAKATDRSTYLDVTRIDWEATRVRMEAGAWLPTHLDS